MEELSRIKKVDLRKVWKHEASDFTTWLSRQENMDILSEEIGLDLETVETEASVGSFYVDILAKETNTDKNVIIENQLESTNHNHLGKIITYASGYDASIIIWIVKDVRDEHKQAIDWLNEHTDENVNFFLIKMEVWQIGDSPYAPKFQIVSKPNDWTKSIRTTYRSGLTETESLRLKFWTEFREYLIEKGTTLKLSNPGPHTWYALWIGNSKAHLDLSVLKTKNKISVELHIPDSKDLYYCLESRKEEIEDVFGKGLVWMPLENRKASRIIVSKKADLSKTSNWRDYFEWLRLTSEKMKEAFEGPIKECTKSIKQ